MTHNVPAMTVFCIGALQRCIVACIHLGNRTGGKTATIAAPLLLPGGPVRYEAGLHNIIVVFVCV